MGIVGSIYIGIVLLGFAVIVVMAKRFADAMTKFEELAGVACTKTGKTTHLELGKDEFAVVFAEDCVAVGAKNANSLKAVRSEDHVVLSGGSWVVEGKALICRGRKETAITAYERVAGPAIDRYNKVVFGVLTFYAASFFVALFVARVFGVVNISSDHGVFISAIMGIFAPVAFLSPMKEIPLTMTATALLLRHGMSEETETRS